MLYQKVSLFGNIAPYGYKRVKLSNSKGYSLEVDEKEANIVSEIYRLYAYENKSINGIARQLNEMNLKPRIIDEWGISSVKDILDNPTYIGKIAWKRRKAEKTTKNGKIVKSRPRNCNYLIYNGLHRPIIDMDTWNIVKGRARLSMSSAMRPGVAWW